MKAPLLSGAARLSERVCNGCFGLGLCLKSMFLVELLSKGGGEKIEELF
jgi:hypothetical protein